MTRMTWMTVMTGITGMTRMTEIVRVDEGGRNYANVGCFSVKQFVKQGSSLLV